jgi:hypothetical protein
MGQEYFGSFLEYGPFRNENYWNLSLGAWFEGISKLSVVNLEKPRMVTRWEVPYWKENHSHRSSYDWNMGLAGLRWT